MPVQAVLGASAVEFRLCRPKSKQTRQDIRDFPEYAELPVGRAMMTLEYCTGHLHARYEWVAEELRQAVVERFPEVKVRCFSSSSTFFPAAKTAYSRGNFSDCLRSELTRCLAMNCRRCF